MIPFFTHTWSDQRVSDHIFSFFLSFFLSNKWALGARSGVSVTLDLCAHVWIIASCLDCSVTGSQPKTCCVCHECCTDDDQEGWAAHLLQVLPETWTVCSKNYDMIQNIEAVGYTQGKEWFRQSKEGQMSGESDECSWAGTNWWLISVFCYAR